MTAKKEDVADKKSAKLNELMQKLINVNTQMVVEVAACDCKNADKCELYAKAKEIARILKELQKLS